MKRSGGFRSEWRELAIFWQAAAGGAALKRRRSAAKGTLEMKLTLIAALLIGASVPAHATEWTWQTDDGRKVSSNQIDREAAACNTTLTGRFVDNPRMAFATCMRAKGYILHSCGWLGTNCI
jgi:hypothetical protein